MANKHIDGYPLRHREYVRRLKRGLVVWLSATGSVALILGIGYFRDWPFFLFQRAPLAGLIFLIAMLSIPGTIDEIVAVQILPYFKKDRANPTSEIHGDTFLSGKALARNCEFLDELAHEIGVAPISHFGFADDLAGENPIWHEASLGLETISALQNWLQENPIRFEETAAIIDDLARIERSLKSATELGVPFCFLLRHGSSASGHEMDVRQGFFAYK